MRYNPRKDINKCRFGRIVALLLIFLLALSTSCAREERRAYTVRKAEESLALNPEEIGFGADVFLLLDQSGTRRDTLDIQLQIRKGLESRPQSILSIISLRNRPRNCHYKVIAPDGSEHDVKFRREAKGICFGSPHIEDVGLEGVYRIILTMKGGDVYKSSTERRIEVKPIHYLVIDRPATVSALKYSDSLLV